MTDQEIKIADELINELHKIAKSEDVYEYGLPIYSAMDSMRIAVLKSFEKMLDAKSKKENAN